KEDVGEDRDVARELRGGLLVGEAPEDHVADDDPDHHGDQDHGRLRIFLFHGSPPRPGPPRRGGHGDIVVQAHKCKRPTSWEVGRLSNRALAMTYFLTGNPQYHRRGVVSRSCSGWEGVGPTRYGRQEFCKEVVVLDCVLHRGLHTMRKVIESSRTGN